jgi:hypothetical protein
MNFWRQWYEYWPLIMMGSLGLFWAAVGLLVVRKGSRIARRAEPPVSPTEDDLSLATHEQLFREIRRRSHFGLLIVPRTRLDTVDSDPVMLAWGLGPCGISKLLHAARQMIEGPED